MAVKRPDRDLLQQRLHVGLDDTVRLELCRHHSRFWMMTRQSGYGYIILKLIDRRRLGMKSCSHSEDDAFPYLFRSADHALSLGGLHREACRYRFGSLYADLSKCINKE
jgi:hypothetical protein